MRKLAFIFIVIFLHHFAKSQNHSIGVGFGISNFEPPIYINYQFNHKHLNTKLKASLLPIGLQSRSMSAAYDLYVGIKTKEEKRNILYLNVGASLFNPRASVYSSSVSQQINPIVNFEYAFAFNTNSRITADLSISQYNTIISSRSNETKKNVSYIIIEIGYAYRFKKRTKEEKTTN